MPQGFSIADGVDEPPQPDVPHPSRARRQVIRYVTLTLGISFALQIWLLVAGRSIVDFAPLLMWVPALVSIAVRLAGREGFADVGWRLGPPRFLVFAYAVPALCGALTYVAAWAVGAVAFAPPAVQPLVPGSPGLNWAAHAILNATIGVAIASVMSLGEELGWRGYLLTRLVDTRWPGPLLLSGLIWAAWHVPLIVWGDYATSSRPWVSTLLFVGLECILGFIFAWLRLASGSVWPPVLAHSAHNIVYQRVFDRWFAGALEPFLAGEAGVFSLAAYGAVLVWLQVTGRLTRLTAGARREGAARP